MDAAEIVNKAAADLAPMTVKDYLDDIGEFLDDAEHFELADDSTIDITPALNGLRAVEAKIESDAKVIAEKDTEIRSMIAVHNSDVDGMRLQEEKIADQKKAIAALREALQTVRLYIADQMIAHAIVMPDGAPIETHDKFPTLLQVVDMALAVNEQIAGKENDHQGRP